MVQKPKRIQDYYSCKRKRDVVTFSAIAMLFLMILFQVYIIVIAPIQMKKNDLLMEHVEKDQLFKRFDIIRSQVSRFSPKKDNQQGEVTMVLDVLNGFALYLHENRDNMVWEDVLLLKDAVSTYEWWYQCWRRAPVKYHFEEEQINWKAYRSALEKKVTANSGAL